MNENGLKFFAARVQSRITTQLLALFGGLMFALLLVACFPIHVDEKLLAILDRIITAMLPIVGTAVGFWMSRHRDTSSPMPEVGPIPTQPPEAAVATQPKVNP